MNNVVLLKSNKSYCEALHVLINYYLLTLQSNFLVM